MAQKRANDDQNLNLTRKKQSDRNIRGKINKERMELVTLK